MTDGHVFRDEGEDLVFVGDFNGLYKSDSDPWSQSGVAGPMASYYAESRLRLGLALAGYLKRAGSRLEVGCGHGHALALLNNKVRGGSWHGLDVSPRAIKRARQLHPSYRFHVGDITSPLPLARTHAGRFDAVILNQTLWYVLDRLDAAMQNCIRLASPGGLVIVSQAFLRDRQRYGADIAEGFHGTLELLARRFPELRLIEAHYDDTDAHRHHDGLMVFRRVA